MKPFSRRRLLQGGLGLGAATCAAAYWLIREPPAVTMLDALVDELLDCFFDRSAKRKDVIALFERHVGHRLSDKFARTDPHAEQYLEMSGTIFASLKIGREFEEMSFSLREPEALSWPRLVGRWGEPRRAPPPLCSGPSEYVFRVPKRLFRNGGAIDFDAGPIDLRKGAEVALVRAVHVYFQRSSS